MLKPSFDIIPDNWNTQEHRATSMLIEISNSSFTYIFFDRQTKTLQALKHFSLDVHSEKPVVFSIEQIIKADPFLQENVRDAIVVYNYPESNIIPSALFDINLNKPISTLIYGNAERALMLNERVPDWDMYNAYRIPKDIHSLMQQQFAAGKYWHFYSLLIAGVDKDSITSEACVRLVFYSDRFILAAFHHKELFLINTYSYQTPEDVAYYTLSVIKQLDVQPDKVEVILSGLIDEQSALYSELYKYLLDLRFDTLPTEVSTGQLLDYYPPHYFSPLLRTLLCV